MLNYPRHCEVRSNLLTVIIKLDWLSTFLSRDRFVPRNDDLIKTIAYPP
jgi:hypothetical protein